MSDEELRAHIDGLLAAGLQTDHVQRAYTSQDITAACARLQALGAEDVRARLVIAGFMRQPYVAPEDEDGIEQSCATCMYFERHREFCTLPELMLAARPQWSCILWRI